MSLTPAFQGEVQFRRYSDTSTQGQQVVFAVHDRDALEPFFGKEGKRFMAVLVEIGDDEQPVQPIPPKSTELKVPRREQGDLEMKAILWCQSPEFWKFLTHGGCRVRDEAEAKALILSECDIESRRQLDTEPAKSVFLRKIVGPFYKWNLARGLA